MTRSDVPSQDQIRPNLTEGVTPLEQIERRNQASRADAKVQAANRAAAASRALSQLQEQMDNDRAEAARTAFKAELEPLPTLSTPAPAPAAPTRAAATPAAPTPAAKPEPEPDLIEEQPPLLEVKTSPLGADLDHLGDRLAIFVDRVELRDRLDRVRKSIKADDIVDVTVQKRLAGAVLTVESIRGAGIAAKGLRPDQADEARRLILAKTKPVRMAGRTGEEVEPRHASSHASAAAAAKADPPKVEPPKVEQPRVVAPKPVAPKIDAVAMRSKLADLHNAGVLTDDEYQQKLLLVRRLATGETRRTG